MASIELMNSYMPQAEQHIFSAFLNALTEKPSAALMAVILQVEFHANQDYRTFCLSLQQYLKDGKKTRFIESFDSLADTSKSFVNDAKGAMFIKALVG